VDRAHNIFSLHENSEGERMKGGKVLVAQAGKHVGSFFCASPRVLAVLSHAGAYFNF